MTDFLLSRGCHNLLLSTIIERVQMVEGAYELAKPRGFLFLQAEQIIYDKKMDHEYAGIAGIPEFCDAAIRLALGDNHEAVKGGLVSECSFSSFPDSVLVLSFRIRPFNVFRELARCV